MLLLICLANNYVAAQNVGIGTTTPATAYKLHVHTNASTDVSIGLTNGLTGDGNARGGRIRLINSDLDFSNNETTGTINFYTNSSNRLTIAANGNIGIGINTPLALLHVAENSVLFSAAGLPGSFGNTPISGAGRRMMWYADKGAFRAGYVSGSNWDKDSIGVFSFAAGDDAKAYGNRSIAIGALTAANAAGATAVGYQTTAGGLYSTALGFQTTASGTISTALGNVTNASGDQSTAMGFVTTASGVASTALGKFTTASGYVCTAMGYQTIANGSYSTAMGRATVANGDTATAMGFNSTASGNTSTAMGFFTNASGNYSTASGSYTTASGASSTTMGDLTNASGFYSTAMGKLTTASGFASTAMGENTMASGSNSTAMGQSTIANGSKSTAMGYAVTTNGFTGCLIIGDATGIPATPSICYRANEFRARFDGGYAFYSNAAGSAGVFMVNGSNAWSSISDSTKKEKFIKTDGEYVLGSISKMKLGSWNYKSQDAKEFRHYGPMAQEFFNAFGHDAVGKIGSDTLINSADMAGVMMISIQALEKRTAEIKQLQKENMALQQQVTMLSLSLAQIKKQIELIAKK